MSDTALWVAVYRAKETKRADALFHDPLAEGLAGEKGQAIAKHISRGEYVEWSLVIRTCIIDDYIKAALKNGVDTIVNMGAGLDTRPYRLELPRELRWIEVDFAKMIDFKEAKLSTESPRCQLERVKLDLTNPTQRREFLKDISLRSKKVLVLTEGVLPYLSNEDAGTLAEDLRAQESFKYWVLDYYSPQVFKYMGKGRRKTEMRNAPFLFNPGDWFDFFQSRGWKVSEKKYLAEESLRLGRAIPMPWWARILIFVFRPKNRDHFRKFSGYFLLEPA